MPILSNDFLATLNEKVINPAFEVARTNFPGLISQIQYGSPVAPEGGFKHSWLNQQIGAGGNLVNGAAVAAATTINVDDGSFFRAGMQVSVKNSDEVILVTSVAANALTVTRGFGGTVAVDILDNAVLTIDSTAREENSLGIDDGIFEPNPTENYFQTLDTQITLSRRALAQAQIGNYNDMQMQISERINQLTIQLNRMLIRGRKAVATIGGKQVTFAGGMIYHTEQTGGYAVDNAAAALTYAKIDDLVEQIVLRGGMTNTIAVNTRLARVIQGLVNADYSSQRLSESLSDRGALTRLTSDLPILGQINNIVVDTNLGDGELLMLDSTKPKIIPMAANNANANGNWRTLDSTQPGQDGESIRIVGDFGLEMNSFKTNLARLHNIG